MDDSANNPTGTDIPAHDGAEGQTTAETSAQNDQPGENYSLMEAIEELYVQHGRFGIVLIIVISPLIMGVILVEVLWEMNMAMGHWSPPWYMWYMRLLQRWSVEAKEDFFAGISMALDVLETVFTRLLLTRLLVVIPLVTIALHTMGMLAGEGSLVTMIITNDLIYFAIDVVGRMVGGFEHSKFVIFLFVGFVFAMSRVGLINHSEEAELESGQ